MKLDAPMPRKTVMRVAAAAVGAVVGVLVILPNVTLCQRPQSERSILDSARQFAGGGAAPDSLQDSTPQDRSNQRRRGQGGGQGGGRGGGRGGSQGGRQGGGQGSDAAHGPEHIAQTDVPAHAVDVILARPTDRAMTLSVLAYADMQGQISYGTQQGHLASQIPWTEFKQDDPAELVIRDLQPDSQYYYQFAYQVSGDSGLVEGSFHTQRAEGSAFAFTVQADSHLDQNSSGEIYANTLRNALADSPDFHIDLGDTFMTGKYRGDKPKDLYLAQRYYFGLLCPSAPLLLTLGNHDGEPGVRGRSRTSAISLRKKYFPNPCPDDFYTGNAREEAGVGLLQDYYAWRWGDALFVVLDPYWYSAANRGGVNDNWRWTLGDQQYRWLQSTLESSDARHRFVFIHHLVGGADSSARGGAEAARYFEWGGRSLDDRNEFKVERPGWEMPIHQMLVENGVAVVFHGHDHFFAKQDLDGIVYQLVPQPGHNRYGSARTAQAYGYVQGDFLAGSGHLRVTVTPEKAVVDYVLSILPKDERGGQRNAAIAYSYSLAASAE